MYPIISPEDLNMIPLSPMDSAAGSAASHLSPKNPVVRTHSNKSSNAGGNGNSGDKVGISRIL